MNAVFMGTPEFAVYALNALLSSKHTVKAVVTQPDRPSNRGRVFFSPVKKIALENKIPLYQFDKIRNEGVGELKKINPDVIVTAAYGQILSQEIIDIPKYGILNVHASLLPAYRGSSPIQWCIINGEKKTGVTIMKTNIGLDTGDILLAKSIDVLSDDNASSLSEKLGFLGAELLIECLEGLENGSVKPVKQDDSQASYYPMLKKEDGKIDFNKTAEEIDCFIRGVTPWPGAYCFINGQYLKIHSAVPGSGSGRPGEILGLCNNGIEIACKSGSVFLSEIQFEGKKKLSAVDAFNGNKFHPGQFLE